MLLEEIGKAPDVDQMINLIEQKKKALKDLNENIGKKQERIKEQIQAMEEDYKKNEDQLKDQQKKAVKQHFKSKTNESS